MRLIDADRLIDKLRGNVLIDVTPELEKAIEQQPTAFDKDKVTKLYLIHTIPKYWKSTAKRDVRKIKEIMRKFEYDDDLIDSINDDFCTGWEAARDVILNMLSERSDDK